MLRTSGLRDFRQALVSLATSGSPLEARDRLVVVPTRAAATHLVATIEALALDTDDGAFVLPDFVTPGELVDRLAERLPTRGRRLTPPEREILLGVACREVAATDTKPPFRLRPGLIDEILRLYDSLDAHERDTAAFDRIARGLLEPAADIDRGAARLLRQTEFLVATFRAFELRCEVAGVVDAHTLRRQVRTTASPRPWRHVVVAVADEARDPHGLSPADWAVLAQVPGLQELDVVVTETTLAGAQHEALHHLLPGLVEERVGGLEDGDAQDPEILAQGTEVGPLIHRDREEEIAGFARYIKLLVRNREVESLERVALVVHQPLPYVYVMREVMRAAGIPCQIHAALPLAGEPYAAALELVLATVAADFARAPVVALLESPHFRFEGPQRRVSGGAVKALDRELAEAGFRGGADELRRLLSEWRKSPGIWEHTPSPVPAASVLEAIVAELEALQTQVPRAHQLERLVRFLSVHERLPGPDEPSRARQLRGRAAVLGILSALRDASAQFDSDPMTFDDTAAMVRRSIDGQTFALAGGHRGIHLVDAESARFGEFDVVQLAGLVDGEWPDRAKHSIFYSAPILRELGWPADADRVEGLRARFKDLLRLPRHRVVVSTFVLEDDLPVAPSPLLDELSESGLQPLPVESDAHRVFDYEALALEPIVCDWLEAPTREWAEARLIARSPSLPRYHGATAGAPVDAYSLSALEKYLDCPFQYFASRVLRLEEPVDDEEVLSPRARGQFVHEVFQHFFEAWDEAGLGSIGVDTLERARGMFLEVAERLLGRLPVADAALERTRLFGSAAAVGIGDVVLGLEASWASAAQKRFLEHAFQGRFQLGGSDGREVPLRGVVDRIDVLEGRRLRVIDYKTGRVRRGGRALQAPIYALCIAESFTERDGMPWTVSEAGYVSFAERRPYVPVVSESAPKGDAQLSTARSHVIRAVDGIEQGEFPPRPHHTGLCTYCAYPTVCRKDYVGDV